MAETQNRSQETDRTSRLSSAGVEAAAAAASMFSEVFQTMRDRNVTVTTPETSPLSSQETSPTPQTRRDPYETTAIHTPAEPNGVLGFALNSARFNLGGQRDASSFLPPLSIDSNPNVVSPVIRPHESIALSQRTRVSGVGAGGPTEVRIDAGPDGTPRFVRDHLGEWTRTEDDTWTTGEPNYRVRRGRVEIDASGAYSFDNTDYGVRTTMYPDGTTRREMNLGQVTYSVTQNAAGETTEFSDERGNWSRQGNRWFNESSNTTREGRVRLTTFGRFSFAGDEPNTQQSEQLERIDTLRRTLETRYGIRIAREGEPRSDYGRINVAGTPTEQELLTLESTLERTNHVNYNGMTVWFIRPDEMRPGDAQSHMAHYIREESGGPHRCISCHSGVRSADNGDLVLMPSARQTTEGFEGLEGTILHELAHHEQGQTFGHSNRPWGTGNQRTQAIEETIRMIGWMPSTRTSIITENGRTIRSRGEGLLVDNAGGYWSYRTRGEQEYWQRVVGGRVNERGQLVGGRLSRERQDRLTNEQMSLRASVTPVTINYFPTADETDANGRAMFRIDSERQGRNRRTLLETAPALYRVVRELDQQSINRRHGVDPETGEPVFIRAVNGNLVINSERHWRERMQEEYRWIAHRRSH